MHGLTRPFPVRSARGLGFVHVAFVLLSGAALAQTPNDAPPRSADGLPTAGAQAPLPHESHATRSDFLNASADATASDPTAFVKSAAMGQLIEFELGKLALARSKDAAVRHFAERVVKDYRSANSELVFIAQPKGLDVPNILDGGDQDKVRTGKRLPAAGFDKWYIAQMISEQARAVALFEDALNCVDLDLAGFAKKTLPTLLTDQQMANVLPTAVNP